MKLGPCCCNTCPTTTEATYTEATKVVDYALDGGGSPVSAGGIAPYARQPESMPSGPGCPATPDCTHPPSSANPGCGAWRMLFSNQPPKGLITEIDFSYLFNNYNPTGSTIAINRSCLAGFKVLQAIKMWHGRYGFLSEYFAPLTGMTLDVDGRPTAICAGEQMTPDQVKYLNCLVTVLLTQNFPCGGAPFDASGSFSGKVKVDKDTGVRTTEWTAPTHDYPFGTWGAFDDYLAQAVGLSSSDFNTIASDFFDRVSGMNWGVSNYTVTRVGNKWTEKTIVPDQTTREVTMDIAGGVFEDVQWGEKCLDCACAEDSGGTSEWAVLRTERYEVTNTTITWTVEDLTDMLTEEMTAVVTLSSTYTWSQAQATAMALLTGSYWNKDNDVVWPWRTDGYLTIGSQLRYCEVPYSVQPNVGDVPISGMVPDYGSPIAGAGTGGDPYTDWDEIAWFDPAAYVWNFSPEGANQATSIGTLGGPFYDGTVIGKPGKAGANSFSFDHINHGCCGSPATSYIKSYGAHAHTSEGDASSAAAPKTATIWTDLQEAAGIHPGRVIMNFGGGCLVQEMVQLDAATRGQNWSRPCGTDSSLMDEETVRCILEASGDDTSALFKLDVGVVADPGVAIGWHMVVVNEVGYEGLWDVTAVDTSTPDEVHVTATKVGSLPIGFSYEDDEAAVMGRRRYAAAGACSSDWNNTSRRGDYVRLTWGMEYRYLERDRVIALESDDCAPGGSAIRSNPINDAMGRQVESFTVSQHDWTGESTSIRKCRVLTPAEFPETTTVDERYGSGKVLWQSIVLNVMQEAFWQPPHRRCDLQADGMETALWSEDPLGNCTADDGGIPEYFYPQRPWVEARISPPSGAPSWTAETWGGYSKTDDSGNKVFLGFVSLAFPGSVAGLPVAPPLTVPTTCSGYHADELQDAMWCPWMILQNGCNCIAGEGRFHLRYAAQIICCS